MTAFRVLIKGDGVDDAQSTDVFDTAIDWITNAVEQVVDPENPLTWCGLEVDGKLWCECADGGLDAGPGDDGEAVPARLKRVA